MRRNKCQPSDNTKHMSILFFGDINECVTGEHCAALKVGITGASKGGVMDYS